MPLRNVISETIPRARVRLLCNVWVRVYRSLGLVWYSAARLVVDCGDESTVLASFQGTPMEEGSDRLL